MSVKKYCYCENNCKYETLDKEEILAAIAQAIETGKVGECDTGFITTLKTINGTPLKFFVGEQSEYEALAAEQKINLFAIITNDTTKEGILKALEDLNAWKAEIETWRNNTQLKQVSSTATTDGYSNAIFENIELEAGKCYAITYVIDYSVDACTMTLLWNGSGLPTYSTISYNLYLSKNTEVMLRYRPSDKTLMPLHRVMSEGGGWERTLQATASAKIYYREI